MVIAREQFKVILHLRLRLLQPSHKARGSAVDFRGMTIQRTKLFFADDNLTSIFGAYRIRRVS
jgi:hypothetical protein